MEKDWEYISTNRLFLFPTSGDIYLPMSSNLDGATATSHMCAHGFELCQRQLINLIKGGNGVLHGSYDKSRTKVSFHSEKNWGNLIRGNFKSLRGTLIRECYFHPYNSITIISK